MGWCCCCIYHYNLFAKEFCVYLMLEFLCRAPEIDITELESLFSANTEASGGGKPGLRRGGASMNKPEKVQLVSYDKSEPILLF